MAFTCGNSPEHGKYSTYTNHHCRCDECKAAMSVYSMDARRRRKARLESGEVEIQHGKWAYFNWRCSCDICKKGAAEYERKRYLRRKYR